MSGSRHPEKEKNKSNPIPKKPSWIRVKAPTSKFFKETNKLLKEKKSCNCVRRSGMSKYSGVLAKKTCNIYDTRRYLY